MRKIKIILSMFAVLLVSTFASNGNIQLFDNYLEAQAVAPEDAPRRPVVDLDSFKTFNNNLTGFSRLDYLQDDFATNRVGLPYLVPSFEKDDVNGFTPVNETYDLWSDRLFVNNFESDALATYWQDRLGDPSGLPSTFRGTVMHYVTYNKNFLFDKNLTSIKLILRNEFYYQGTSFFNLTTMANSLKGDDAEMFIPILVIDDYDYLGLKLFKTNGVAGWTFYQRNAVVTPAFTSSTYVDPASSNLVKEKVINDDGTVSYITYSTAQNVTNNYGWFNLVLPAVDSWSKIEVLKVNESYSGDPFYVYSTDFYFDTSMKGKFINLLFRVSDIDITKKTISLSFKSRQQSWYTPDGPTGRRVFLNRSDEGGYTVYLMNVKLKVTQTVGNLNGNVYTTSSVTKIVTLNVPDDYASAYITNNNEVLTFPIKTTGKDANNQDFTIPESFNGSIELLGIKYGHSITYEQDYPAMMQIEDNYANFNYLKWSVSSKYTMRTFYKEFEVWISNDANENVPTWFRVTMAATSIFLIGLVWVGYELNSIKYDIQKFGYDFYFDQEHTKPIKNIKAVDFLYQRGLSESGWEKVGDQLSVMTLPVNPPSTDGMYAFDEEGMLLRTPKNEATARSNSTGRTYDYVLQNRFKDKTRWINYAEPIYIQYLGLSNELIQMTSDSRGLHVAIGDDGKPYVFDGDGNIVENLGVYTDPTTGIMLPGTDTTGDGVIDTIVDPDTGETPISVEDYRDPETIKSWFDDLWDNITSTYNDIIKAITTALVIILIIAALVGLLWVIDIMTRNRRHST